MVLRVAAPPPPAWDALLPAEVRRLSAELATVDAYLDDDRFITPWQPHFPEPARSPVGPDPNPAAPAVLETPLPARLRDALPGGQRLDLVAAVLPHRPGPAGSPPHHPGQAGRPGRPRGHRAAQRRAAGKARQRQAAALPQAQDRHHGGLSERGLPDRPGAAGAGGRQASHHGQAGPGCRGRDPNPGSGTVGAQRGAGPAKSPGPCGRAPARPSRSCSR
jgi:hypothetical protein